VSSSWGPLESFALRAMEKKIHFDWIDGFIKEQSAFGFIDFIKQRDRWYRGLTAVISDKNLRLTTRMVLGATVISWSICWIGIFVNYYNIYINFYVRESYFPDWAIVSTSILAGLVGSVYMIGAYRNVSYWFAPIWKKTIMLMMTYFLFMTTLLPSMEAFAVLYSMVRLVYFKVTKTPQDFYVVTKD
jgi:hypothetical protein